MADYADIIRRLEEAEGPSRELDCRIAYAIDLVTEDELFRWRETVDMNGGDWAKAVDKSTAHSSIWRTAIPAYTASLDASIALVERMLPGWGWRVATCYVSDDAWLFPDVNDPEHGERLEREFGAQYKPNVEWVEITDVDLSPPRKSAAIALLISLFTALSYIEQKREGTHD